MGQLDSPLTDLGILQAEAIANRLKLHSISSLYSSDLGRAIQTADYISTAVECEVRPHEGLRERHMGIFQGLTRSEAQDNYPTEWADYGSMGFEYIIPEGESASQRLDRSIRTMTAIAEENPDSDVVVVTHGGFLMGFFEYVLGLSPGNGWRFKRHNASYSLFDYSQNRWSLVTWNDVSHLGDKSSLDDPTTQQ